MAAPLQTYLRQDYNRPLQVTELDAMAQYLEGIALATNNSLVYSTTRYPDAYPVPGYTWSVFRHPQLGYFTSKVISYATPSFYQLSTGNRIRFNFSNTDGQNTYQWQYWQNLYNDMITDASSYKVLTVSRIGTSSQARQEFWKFRIDSRYQPSGQTGSTSSWIFDTTMISGLWSLGGFITQSTTASYKYLISWYEVPIGATGPAGPTGISIGATSAVHVGTVSYTFTNFNDPILAEDSYIANRLYLGDLTYPLPIGASGSTSTGGTNSLVGIGGDGIIANRLYLGDITYPLPIGATGSTSTGGTNSLVGIGGEGLFANRMYLGDLTYPVYIGMSYGSTQSATYSTMRVSSDSVQVKYLDLGTDDRAGRLRFNIDNGKSLSLRFAGENNDGNSTFEQAHSCYRCGERGGGKCPCLNPFARCCPANDSIPTGIRHSDPRIKSVEDAATMVFMDDDQNISASIIANTIAIGSTLSNVIEFITLDKIGTTASTSWEPDLTFTAFRPLTSSQSPDYWNVGFDIYNVSTSYLEVTPPTYSGSYSNILLTGSWGNTQSSTYSILHVESDAVSVKSLYVDNLLISTSNNEVLINNQLSSINRVFTMSSTQSFGNNLPNNFNQPVNNVINNSGYIIQPVSAMVQTVNVIDTPIGSGVWSLDLKAAGVVVASSTFSLAPNELIPSVKNWYLQPNGKGFSGDSALTLDITSGTAFPGLSFSNYAIARVALVYNLIAIDSVGFDPEV
jgi:hypothetical protein